MFYAVTWCPMLSLDALCWYFMSYAGTLCPMLALCVLCWYCMFYADTLCLILALHLHNLILPVSLWESQGFLKIDVFKNHTGGIWVQLWLNSLQVMGRDSALGQQNTLRRAVSEPCTRCSTSILIWLLQTSVPESTDSELIILIMYSLCLMEDVGLILYNMHFC